MSLWHLRYKNAIFVNNKTRISEPQLFLCPSWRELLGCIYRANGLMDSTIKNASVHYYPLCNVQMIIDIKLDTPFTCYVFHLSIQPLLWISIMYVLLCYANHCSNNKDLFCIEYILLRTTFMWCTMVYINKYISSHYTCWESVSEKDLTHQLCPMHL